MRIAHLTTVHPLNDGRILFRECLSLAETGHETALFGFADTDARLPDIDVEFVTLPRPGGGRISRLFGQLKLWRLMRKWRPDICHIHDPELIPVAVVMSWLGQPFVYDAHEDLPLQVSGKQWIPKPLRPVFRWLAQLLTWLADQRAVGIIAATEAIAKNWRNPRRAVVRNLPDQLPKESCPTRQAYSARQASVVYVGSLSVARGIETVLAAAERLESSGTDCEFRFYGAFAEVQDAKILQGKMEQLSNVHWYGTIPRHQVNAVLRESRIGIVTLLPQPNYIDALPTKLFEYMAAGLPVIASDFPLWRQIVVDNGAGLCVDPVDCEAIVRAVQLLLEHPEDAWRMGCCGARVVREVYNWDREKQRLLTFYDQLSDAVAGAHG